MSKICTLLIPFGMPAIRKVDGECSLFEFIHCRRVALVKLLNATAVLSRAKNPILTEVHSMLWTNYIG